MLLLLCSSRVCVCACACVSVCHIEMVHHLRRTMTSTSELFTPMTAGSDDVAPQKYLPELSKVALVMVRVLVVLRFIISAWTLMLPRAFTSRRVPFWYHNTSGAGNPLALQVSVPFSNSDMFTSMGISNRMGFTGGVGRGGATESQRVYYHTIIEAHYHSVEIEMG